MLGISKRKCTMDTPVHINGNEKKKKISRFAFILFRISGREPDTKHYLENKMAAENLGVNLFFKYICRKGYIRNRISERDNEV